MSDKNAQWDLAVIDLFLLQGTGINIIKGCRNRNARQKVVVLTNHATPLIRQRCLALGADAVFDKLSGMDELVRYAAQEVQRTDGVTVW